jgi:hypothetical protein
MGKVNNYWRSIIPEKVLQNGLCKSSEMYLEDDIPYRNEERVIIF